MGCTWLQAQRANSTMRAELDHVMKDREAAYAARDAAVAKAQKVKISNTRPTDGGTLILSTKSQS